MAHPRSTVYLDNHATTQVDPRVVDAMLPYFTQQYGNPGSVSHGFGTAAEEAVAAARATIAEAIGARPREIVFTSGATESNNLALRGSVERMPPGEKHLLSLRTEHRAVLDPLARLEREGCQVTLLDVVSADHPQAGLVELDRLVDSLQPNTRLVSVMLANNEIGVIQPAAEIAQVCRERGILTHCDATQAVGKIPVDVRALDVDLLSFTAHKIYGPKGIGALYVRRGVRLKPLIEGGGHERGMRSGTLNVPGIVGFAAAFELCQQEMSAESARLSTWRDRLYVRLSEELSGEQELLLNGPALAARELRLPQNLNVSIPRVDGEALLANLRQIAVSSGSACTSTNPDPSHVLRALGRDDELARSSLRVSFGRFNQAADVETAAADILQAVQRLRRLSAH